MNKKYLILAVLASLGISSAAYAVPVYFNDFESAVGTELASMQGSTLGLNNTPTNRRFLGYPSAVPYPLVSLSALGNDTVNLSLSGLAPHSLVTLALDLFILGSWDGDFTSSSNPLIAGPDRWMAGHSGNLTNLQDTNFSNTFTQCYPSNAPCLISDSPARTGADEPANSLGYQQYGYAFDDSVYNLSYTFAHTGSTLLASFTALTDIYIPHVSVGEVDYESWGIDNLRVEIDAITDPLPPPPISGVPEPASLALLGLGLAGLVSTRRRKAS